MTTETPLIPFHDTLENLEFTGQLGYLLNFWHTTKLNKESEYIKRNGLHPVIETLFENNTNKIAITTGNSIETNFYTVFRIFLENIFKQAKAMKTRGIEEWKITFDDSVNPVDNALFLKLYYTKNLIGSGTNLNLETISFPTYRSILVPKITFNQKDQLYSKTILNDLGIIDLASKRNIDISMSESMDILMRKLTKYHLDAPEKVPKANPVRIQVEKQAERWATDPYPSSIQRAPFGQTDDVAALTPFWINLINTLPPTFSERTNFSFVLNYAKGSGANIAVHAIQDTDANYTAFINQLNRAA